MVHCHRELIKPTSNCPPTIVDDLELRASRSNHCMLTEDKYISLAYHSQIQPSTAANQPKYLNALKPKMINSKSSIIQKNKSY